MYPLAKCVWVLLLCTVSFMFDNTSPRPGCRVPHSSSAAFIKQKTADAGKKINKKRL